MGRRRSIRTEPSHERRAWILPIWPHSNQQLAAAEEPRDDVDLHEKGEGAAAVGAAIDAWQLTIVTLTSERDQPSQEERGSRGYKPEPLRLPALTSRPEAAAVRALDGAPHHAYRIGAPARDGRAACPSAECGA